MARASYLVSARYGAWRPETGLVLRRRMPELVSAVDTERLIAWIIVSKFGDHLPIYRKAGIFERQGLHLDRGTLGNWVGRACFHLLPVIDHMKAHLRAADRIFVDETRAPVLEPGRKATKSGYFWGVVMGNCHIPEGSRAVS